MINSAVEMSEYNDIKYLVVKDGFVEYFFKNSDKQFYKNMSSKMDKTQLSQNSRDGLHKMQNGDGKYMRSLLL